MKKLIMGLLALAVVFVEFAQARVLLVPGTASWYADRYRNSSYGYYNGFYCDDYYGCNSDYLYRDNYQRTYVPHVTYQSYRHNDYNDSYDYRYYRNRDDDIYRYSYDDYDYDRHYDDRYYDRNTPLLSEIPTYIPYTHDNAYYQTTPDKTKVVRLDYYYDRYGNPYVMKYDY